MDVESIKLLAAVLALAPLWKVAQALSNIFTTGITSIARNPGARDAVFPVVIIGFAITEAIALFALVVSFMILFS